MTNPNLFDPIMRPTVNLTDAHRDLLHACLDDEATSENAGTIRVLCELVLAVHRNAAALEALQRTVDADGLHLRAILNAAKKGE